MTEELVLEEPKKLKKKSTRGPSRFILRLDTGVINKLVDSYGYSNYALLARRIGKSRGTVSLWLRGSGIPLEMAELLAEMFNTTVGNILSEETKRMLKSLLQSDKSITVSLPRKVMVDKLLVPTDGKPLTDAMAHGYLDLIIDLVVKEMDGLSE